MVVPIRDIGAPVVAPRREPATERVTNREQVIPGDEKSRPRRLQVTVPQTDTGRRGENPKAFELTTAKELGKFDP